MSGAEEVVVGIDRREGVEYSGLVLNERGWERLAVTWLDRVNCTLAATESFNRRNGNASLAEAVERVEAILAAADRPATVTSRRPGRLPVGAARHRNVATEDLVWLLEAEGAETGIDLDALIATSEWLESVLGRRLEGYLYRAGPWP